MFDHLNMLQKNILANRYACVDFSIYTYLAHLQLLIIIIVSGV